MRGAETETSRLSGIFISDCLAADVRITRRRGEADWGRVAKVVEI